MKAVFIVVLLIMQVKRGCLMMRWLECMRANFKLPHERTRAAAGEAYSQELYKILYYFIYSLLQSSVPYTWCFVVGGG